MRVCGLVEKFGRVFERGLIRAMVEDRRADGGFNGAVKPTVESWEGGGGYGGISGS